MRLSKPIFMGFQTTCVLFRYFSQLLFCKTSTHTHTGACTLSKSIRYLQFFLLWICWSKVMRKECSLHRWKLLSVSSFLVNWLRQEYCCMLVFKLVFSSNSTCISETIPRYPEVCWNVGFHAWPQISVGLLLSIVSCCLN